MKENILFHKDCCGGSLVKTLSSNAGDVGSNPCRQKKTKQKRSNIVTNSIWLLKMVRNKKGKLLWGGNHVYQIY